MRLLIQKKIGSRVVDLKGGIHAGVVVDSGCDTLEHDIYFNPNMSFIDYMNRRRRRGPEEI